MHRFTKKIIKKKKKMSEKAHAPFITGENHLILYYHACQTPSNHPILQVHARIWEEVDDRNNPTRITFF